MPRERGGLGLSVVGPGARCYEEMNASIFGPACFNCAAPDDGNMTVLAKVGTAAQKARWLAPIVDGRVRSSFVMTEPHPGGGSDPTMIRTRAERRGERWVVHGRKWFITGAGVAQHFILIARTTDDERTRADGLHVRSRPAGLAHRAAHPDHGAGGARRALRARVRRPGDSRRGRASWRSATA